MKIITAGTARLDVIPDVATLNFRVSARSTNRQTAVEEVNQALAPLRAQLAQVDARVKSETANTSSWMEKKVKEFEVAVQLVVESTNAEVIAELLQTGVAVEGCEVNGPNWRVSPTHPIHQEVREAAIGEAIERAKGYAKALGGVLSKILEVRDEAINSIEPRPAMMMGARMMDAPVPLDVDTTPRETTVSATVIVTSDAIGVQV